MLGDGVTTVNGGIELSIANDPKTLNRRLENANNGVATYQQGGTFGYWDIQAEGEFNNLAGSTLEIAGGIQGAGAINNSGSITGGGSITCRLNNAGVMDVGSLKLGNGTNESGASINANTIDFGGTFEMAEDSNLTVNNIILSPYYGVTSIPWDMTIDSLTINGSTLTGDGNIVINGPFVWVWGTMSGNGVTTVNGGMDLVQSNNAKTLNRRLENANNGVATYQQGGTFGYWDIQAEGEFNNLAGSTLEIAGGIQGAGAINNSGSITGGGSITCRLNNAGVMDVGSLKLGNGTNESGASINANTIDFGGTFEMAEDSNLTVNNIILSPYYGVTSIPWDMTLDSLTIDGNILTGSGNIVVNGPLVWSAGTMSGDGKTTANGGILITGGGEKYLYRKLDNANNQVAVYGVEGQEVRYWRIYGEFNNLAGSELKSYYWLGDRGGWKVKQCRSCNRT